MTQPATDRRRRLRAPVACLLSALMATCTLTVPATRALGDEASPALVKYQERIDESIARALVWLAEEQKEDGSWQNVHPRWWESNPVLATAYAVLALEICLE